MEIVGKRRLYSIEWYLRQLLPLTYRTIYTDTDGNKHFCVWNMWLGRSFNVEDYIIKPES